MSMVADDLTAPAREAVASGDVPGALSLVWRQGEVADLQLQGVIDVERQAPMRRDAIFGVASMTKPITVATALTLVEQGVIALDDPIARWAPEFADMRVLRRPDGPLDEADPAPRQITVEDLMTHRSGLGYGFTERGPLAGALMRTIGFGVDSAMTPDQWLAALAQFPLACAPGERFNYGHSTDVLGFVIARAAGLPLRDLMRREVFDPLGMVDTDFWIAPRKRERAATPYNSPAPGRFVPMQMSGYFGPEPPAYTSGGQGLVTTADDYLTFARMLLGGGEANGARVLKPETVQLMTTNRLSPAQRQGGSLMGIPIFATSGMGLGVSVVMEPERHAARGAGRAGAFTWPGAFGGWWQADPAAGIILIWLQMALPAQPAPGVPPRMPGMAGTMAFQKAAYAAFDR